MNDEQQLTDFFQRIWKEEKGFVYLGIKDPKKQKGEPNFWVQHFFEWPFSAATVVNTVLDKRDEYDVYFAPALFDERSSLKEHVIGANVFWIESDGTTPTFDTVPPPSIVVQSSDETHNHYYWLTSELTSRFTLESVNRALTYELGADASGWDCNQVLRPPCTLNHGKSKRTKLLSANSTYFGPVAFEALTVKNLPASQPPPKDIPDFQEVIRKYKYSESVWKLFKEGVKVDRSAGLMALGYHLTELGLSDAECFTMLHNADSRWGKFARRTDQAQRLFEIVLRARIKFPFKNDIEIEEPAVQLIDVVTFLATEIKLEWVWQDLLQQDGYFLLTGPTGTGKTQLSLNFAASAALGKTFLDREISTSKRVAFISLEMNDVELQYFLQQQMTAYTLEEKEILKKNFLTLPVGYPIYMNREPNRKVIEELVERYELNGIIFDSLGSMTNEDVSKPDAVKEIMDWNDTLRNKYKVFTWIIHHHRKAQGQNKRPNKIDDVYGSHYITARASSVVALWPAKGQSVEVLPLKIRLAAKPDGFTVTRNANLTFTMKANGLIVLDDSIDEEADVTDTTTMLQDKKMGSVGEKEMF